ncbi:hypothetical protein G6F63_016341 [Rhizopus arrhizus]|nr:hypothetical protein G6F63_016341 [Rhizopus arrhizus]
MRATSTTSRAAGWWKASARTSCRRSPISAVRHSRWLVHRHPAGRRLEVLPRADHAEEGAGAGAGYRQQVPVEDVQRLLDAGQRLPAAPAARRPARPDPAPVRPA